MSKKGLLLVVSGPSGCGKGTIMKELLSRNDSLFLSVSATTRAPRPGEIDGTHYFFLSREKFEEEIAQDGMIEHACYCDNYYGTPKRAVFDRLEKGEDVILEIEVQGAMQVMEKYHEAVSIFIIPPSMEELERRLTDRNTEDSQTIAKRMKAACDEMKFASKYDYIVVNDTVTAAAEEIEAIIRAEKSRTVRMADFLDKIVK